jgi:phosphatidylglycerol lysyltransferase
VRISLHEGMPSAEGLYQLEQISSAWLEHKSGRHTSEMGFSTGRLSELSETAQRADTLASIPLNGARRVVPRVVTLVATTSAGKPCAFVTFLPVYGSLAASATATGSQSGVEGWGWTLDLMRRTPDAPPGVIELLLVWAIELFRSCGAQVVSLGLAAMADTRLEMTPGQGRLAGFVTDRLHLLESRRSLFNFKQKFHPRWESRYIVTSSSLALPKIAMAILRLRSYSGGGLVRLMR